MWRVSKRHVHYAPMFSFSHPCNQNLGIVVAFGISFLAAHLILTEFRSKLAETRSVVNFKRGTMGIHTSVSKAEDVETTAIAATNSVNGLCSDDAKAEKALATAEKMTNDFSWEGLNHTVSISDGGEKKFLNDISGYVVPGKLTVLMGKSGARNVRTHPSTKSN